jgi:hypothetical protein
VCCHLGLLQWDPAPSCQLHHPPNQRRHFYKFFDPKTTSYSPPTVYSNIYPKLIYVFNLKNNLHNYS